MQAFFKGKRAPSFRVGTGPKAEIDMTTRRIVPGPGNYDTSKMYILNKSVGGVSFGKSIRDSMKGNDLPGPGHYKVPVKFADVPKYLIPKIDDEFRFV